MTEIYRLSHNSEQSQCDIFYGMGHKMPDQEAFYVYGENGRMNYLAHILGVQQSVVWGTGTHTNTPVALITYGPAAATQRFTGFMHATDIGKGMITLIRGE